MRRISLRRFVSVIAAAALLIGNTVALAHASMLAPTAPSFAVDGGAGVSTGTGGHQPTKNIDEGDVGAAAIGDVQSPDTCDDGDCAPITAAICVLNVGCMATCAIGSGAILCDAIGLSGAPTVTFVPQKDAPLLARASPPEFGPPRI